MKKKKEYRALLDLTDSAVVTLAELKADGDFSALQKKEIEEIVQLLQELSKVLHSLINGHGDVKNSHNDISEEEESTILRQVFEILIRIFRRF